MTTRPSSSQRRRTPRPRPVQAAIDRAAKQIGLMHRGSTIELRKVLEQLVRQVRQETYMGAIEQIICAAIMFDDGTVIRGHRHNDCLRTAWDIPLDVRPKGRPRQGFMTSFNSFADRVLAREIQQRAGIPSKRGAYQHELYSEDVY